MAKKNDEVRLLKDLTLGTQKPEWLQKTEKSIKKEEEKTKVVSRKKSEKNQKLEDNDFESIKKIFDEVENEDFLKEKSSLSIPKKILMDVNLLGKKYGLSGSNYVTAMIIFFLQKNKKRFKEIVKSTAQERINIYE